MRSGTGRGGGKGGRSCRPVIIALCMGMFPVQAVFKVYDTDQSGTISYEEFEAISSNFPFIECFSVLDQDK